MHRLEYPPQSLIHSVDIAKTAGGSTRAYLHARDSASPEQLKTICNSLRIKGWTATPTTLNGKPTLEVRGFGKEKTLDAFLKGQEFSSGEGKKTGESKTNFRAWIKENTFLLVGGIYAVGDVAYTFIYGILNQLRVTKTTEKRDALDAEFSIAKSTDKEEKAWQNTMSGFSYNAGTGVAAIWGGNRSERQYNDMALKLSEFYKAQNLSLDKDSSLAVTAIQQSGLGARFNNFMGKYAAEVTNGFFGLAGVFIASYGFSERNREIKDLASGKIDKRTWLPFGDMFVGISTALAGLVSVFVKEKHLSDAEKAELAQKGPLTRAKAWVQTRPLQIAATLFTGSTVAHGVVTAGGYLHNRKRKSAFEETLAGIADKNSYAYRRAEIDLADVNAEIIGNAARGAFVISNGGAEVAQFEGEKTHGVGVGKEQSVIDGIIDGVAEAIAYGKQSQRDILLEKSADFLADPEMLGGEPGDLAAKLRDRVASLQSNPWARFKTQEKSAPIRNNPTEETLPPSEGKWVAAHQSRLAQTPQPQMQPSF